MGGNLSVSQRNELLASVAAKVLANSSGAQALDLSELLHPHAAMTSSTAAPLAAAAAASTLGGSKKSKNQCRWCLETFEKKWNKDRHEARKHELELDASLAAEAMGNAAAAEPAPADSLSGRKRKGSVTLETHTNQDAQSDSAAHSAAHDQLDNNKRARVDEVEKTDDEDAAAEAAGEVTEEPTMDGEPLQQIEGDEHGSTSTEPGEQASDEAIKQQIAALNEELADEEAVKSGDLFDENTRAELQAADAQIAACCLPFLSWLCAPAVTESERLVKARRVDPKQLAPVKKNLAFIIKALLGTNVVQPGQVKLDLFTQESVCQKLNTFLEERQVGSSRIYALFLLIKKVLVYLSSSESVRKREYIPPNTWNSWTCVDSICSDSNTRRKQLSSNRKLLGAEQCKNIEAAPMRAGPTAEDLRMPALYGEKKKLQSTSAKAALASVASNLHDSPSNKYPAGHTQVEPQSSGHHTSRSSAPAAASSSAMNASPSLLQLRADPNELTPSELRQVTQGCLEFLNRPTVQSDSRFVRYLVTATECLAMAPRQQVLRQLQVGSSFVRKDDGRYWIVMLAHMNKNNRATTFPISMDLTAAYDTYLSEIRPRLLGEKEHNYVFCKQTGAAPGPTFDFSDWTGSVCKELLGRKVNCHAFRGALITTFYKCGATQTERDALAAVMAHDPTTALGHYFKDDAQQQALEIQERMREAYGLNVPEAAAAPAAAADAAFGVHSPASGCAQEVQLVNESATEDAHMATPPDAVSTTDAASPSYPA